MTVSAVPEHPCAFLLPAAIRDVPAAAATWLLLCSKYTQGRVLAPCSQMSLCSPGACLLQGLPAPLPCWTLPPFHSSPAASASSQTERSF